MPRSNFWRWLRVIAPITLLLPVTLGCPSRPVEKPVPDEVAGTCRNLAQTLEKDVDILFVVDNSPSMEQEQKMLQDQFPKLIDALKTAKLGGKIPNVHIGVVSPNLGAGPYTTIDTCKTVGGDRGIMQNTARLSGCAGPTDKWISYIDGNTNIPSGNADPIERVKESFSCIAALGKAGCGFEHQLEAARQALDPTLKRNEGFLREDALLVIVLITDEDDCSAKRTELFDPTQDATLGPFNFRCFDYGITCDVNGRQTPGPRVNCRPTVDTTDNPAYLYSTDDYVKFFKGLKDEGRVMFAAIAGPTTPVVVDITDKGPSLKASCTGALGNADPAIRIKSVVDAFGDLGQFNNICEGNFGAALDALGKKIVASLGGQCIGAPPLSATGNIVCLQGDALGTNSKGQAVTCQKSCLDLAECTVEDMIGGDSGNIQTVKKCPAALFNDPSEKPSCGSDCPCWRLHVPTGEEACTNMPYGLQVLRATEPAKGTRANVCCSVSVYPFKNALYADKAQCDSSPVAGTTN